MQRQSPPRNIDAEISVVGGLLFNGRALDKVSGVVGPEDFYDPRHEVIFDAVTRVAATGHPVDCLTVAAELRRTGGMAKLEASGAEAFLFGLANQVSSIEGIGKHAHMVKEKSFLRRLIVETGRIQDRAYSDQEPAEAIIESAQANILGLAALSPKKEPKHISKIVHGNILELERRMSSPGAIGGVPSGIEELDEITSGAQAGHLDVLAGRPGMGKTALAMSWVMHAVTTGHPCLVFSIEMPEDELGMRALSGAGQVDNSLMRSGLLTSKDWSRIMKAAEWQSHLRAAGNRTANGLAILGKSQGAVWWELRSRGLQIDHVSERVWTKVNGWPARKEDRAKLIRLAVPEYRKAVEADANLDVGLDIADGIGLTLFRLAI
jgi:replicative DNA helicase